MTRQEVTGIRSLEFSQWVRDNLPDSSLGLIVTDLDFILYNYNTHKIMLLEIKTRNAELKLWQSKLFSNLSRWIEKGIDNNWQYLGFHVVRFEHTFFNDGKCYLDNKETNENALKIFLSCV